MKKSTGILLGVLGVVLVLVISVVGWGISSYNGLVGAQTEVEKQSSDIQTQLQRRSDLIPNLVETVKGYAAHEEKIFTDIAEARSKLSGANTMAEMDEANNALSSALSRLLVVVERYPDLKANQNFINLQTQLEGTENRIAYARKTYNEAVQSYNTRIRKFPTSLIAGMFGFEKAESFQGSEGIENPPDVKF